VSLATRKILPNLQEAKKLFVVIPAYNEGFSLSQVLLELKNLPFENYEAVVVDDGSKDHTCLVAKKAGVPIVSHPFNMGIGITVQTGFRYALEHGADLVVQVDGDGQHIPSEIKKLFSSLLEKKADVVVGSRFLKHGKIGMESTTFLRWMAGRILSWTVWLLTRQHLTDTTSGFRLFNKRAADFIAYQYPDDYPEVEVLVSLARAGFKIIEVPVQMRSRQHGVSSINWWRAIYYVVKVFFATCMEKIR